MNQLPVAIIGGGPVGAAAAAHLLKRGEAPVLFEAGAAQPALLSLGEIPVLDERCCVT